MGDGGWGVGGGAGGGGGGVGVFGVERGMRSIFNLCFKTCVPQVKMT